MALMNEAGPSFLLLASLASFLATPLAKLYNNSIATGKIPVELKSAQPTRKVAKITSQITGLFA